MTADVLLYNALNANNKRLVEQVAAIDADISTQNSLCQSTINSIETNSVEVIANSGPYQTNMWSLIPEGSGWTGDLKVCDTSGNFRCGACCAWTVPAGVTCARFQLWGAGAGTGSACCCGFSPIGGTGAYASVIIPVTAGDTYTLCSGCAYCCYACRSQHDADGCASFVTGTGLTNFCAEGGEGSLFCEVRTRCVYGAINNSWCMYLGGCICNGGTDVCMNGDQRGLGSYGTLDFPMISSCKSFYGTATNGTVFGIRGSFGYTRLISGTIICVQHPPIYGFPTTSCCNCCINEPAIQGCARSAANGYMQIPGAGGWAGFKCGGQTNCAGDAGRMGMVCVSYK